MDRQPRPRRVAGILFTAILTMNSFAHADIIDFENLQPVTVISQYSNLGVTFNGPRLFDYSQTSAIAHSGGKAIELCYAVEFCTTSLVVSFTEAQRRVKLWVGYSAPLPVANTVVLQAFDANAALVAQASAVLPASTVPVPVQTLLQVVAAPAKIRRVVLSFEAGPDGHAYNNGLVVDDIEFDRVGGPPPCSASSTPFVALMHPTISAEFSVNQFPLQGSISTAAPLEEARLTVTGLSLNPAPVRVTDLLSGSIVGLSGGPFGINVGDGLYPGFNLVSVQARNCFGWHTDIRLVTFTPIVAGTQFKLLGLEVVQATQDLQNTVPLISNKSTIVRAYIGLDGPTTSIANVTGSLMATPPGGSAIPPLLHSTNAITATSSQDVYARRLDITASVNFVLPDEWTADRTLHLEVSKLQVQGIEVNLPCDGCRNLDAINAPRWTHFNPTRPMHLVIAPYVYAHTSPLTPDILLTPMGALQWLNNVYPLSGHFPLNDSGVRIVRILPMNSTSKDLSFASDEGGDFLDELEDIRGALQNYYSGVWPSDFHLLAILPCNCGRARDSVRVAYVDTYNLEATSPDVVPQASFEAYGMTWAHELGHNLGRNHLGSDHGESSGGDVDTGSSIPHGGIGEPGLAINTDQWLGSPFVVKPGNPAASQKHAHDFMSYGHTSGDHQNSWVSPYTYKALYAKYLQAAQALAPVPQSSSEKVIAAGRIKPDGTVILRPFQRRITSVEVGPGTKGNYTMELLDESGAVLHSHVFDAHKSEGTKDLSFHEVIAWKDGTRQFVMKGASGALAKREVSPNNPWVRVATPAGKKDWSRNATIRWEAGDKDGDSLTYTVLYAAGGDDSWLPVANGVKESSITIDTRLLPGSSRARIRVEATDGVNMAHADSASFVVAGKSPRVEIFTPREETKIVANTPVQFVGISYDAEDGMLPDASLVWESDRDGRLGQGRQFHARLRSSGKHSITLTATDQDRQSATAHVTLTVGDARDVQQSPVGTPRASPDSR